MSTKQVQHLCPLSEDQQNFLLHAAGKLSISARAYYNIIKVARTIADLDETQNINIKHLAEALQYRHHQEII